MVTTTRRESDIKSKFNNINNIQELPLIILILFQHNYLDFLRKSSSLVTCLLFKYLIFYCNYLRRLERFFLLFLVFLFFLFFLDDFLRKLFFFFLLFPPFMETPCPTLLSFVALFTELAYTLAFCTLFDAVFVVCEPNGSGLTTIYPGGGSSG